MLNNRRVLLLLLTFSLLLLVAGLPYKTRLVTVIATLKLRNARHVTLACIVNSMWACTAVEYAIGGFMPRVLAGTPSSGLMVVSRSCRVHGI